MHWIRLGWKRCPIRLNGVIDLRGKRVELAAKRNEFAIGRRTFHCHCCRSGANDGARAIGANDDDDAIAAAAPELHRRHEPEYCKTRIREKEMATPPRAAAPVRRLNQTARVGPLTELGVSAPASRAREGNEFRLTRPGQRKLLMRRNSRVAIPSLAPGAISSTGLPGIRFELQKR